MTLWRRDGDDWRCRLHLGQIRAFESQKRFVAVLAGVQSGKTTFGPVWLARECERHDWAGDYLAITATYDLFKLKMLPALRETFENVFRRGRYWSGDRVIELCDPTGRFHASRSDDVMYGRIILRSADSDSGLESATALAAWLDEAGLVRSAEPWDAVRSRLSLSMGRVLITTTLYDFGWIKKTLYEPWEAARRNHPDIDVVSFDSIANPSFPRAEYEERQTSMPLWKFNMRYRGQYTRPAGMIYDCFDPLLHVCRPFAIDPSWRVYLGLDFGGVNTAGVFLAEEPGGKFYLFREYHAGSRTARQHRDALAPAIVGNTPLPNCIGGSKSEGQWRDEFAAAGLPVGEPLVKDVEVGINRVYSLFQRDKIRIFSSCSGVIDELNNYSRTTDENGNPTETIENKEIYHKLDALRYISTLIAHGPREPHIW